MSSGKKQVDITTPLVAVLVFLTLGGLYLVFSSPLESIETPTINIPSSQESLDEIPVYNEEASDFPELGLDKDDIFDILNHNEAIIAMLSSYDRVGWSIEDASYTMYIEDGKATDVVRELVNPQITVMMSKDDFLKMIAAVDEQNYASAAKYLLTSDLPTKEKTKLVLGLKELL